MATERTGKDVAWTPVTHLPGEVSQTLQPLEFVSSSIKQVHENVCLVFLPGFSEGK